DRYNIPKFMEGREKNKENVGLNNFRLLIGLADILDALDSIELEFNLDHFDSIVCCIVFNFIRLRKCENCGDNDIKIIFEMLNNYKELIGDLSEKRNYVWLDTVLSYGADDDKSAVLSRGFQMASYLLGGIVVLPRLEERTALSKEHKVPSLLSRRNPRENVKENDDQIIEYWEEYIGEPTLVQRTKQASLKSVEHSATNVENVRGRKGKNTTSNVPQGTHVIAAQGGDRLAHSFALGLIILTKLLLTRPSDMDSTMFDGLKRDLEKNKRSLENAESKDSKGFNKIIEWFFDTINTRMDYGMVSSSKKTLNNGKALDSKKLDRLLLIILRCYSDFLEKNGKRQPWLEKRLNEMKEKTGWILGETQNDGSEREKYRPLENSPLHLSETAVSGSERWPMAYFESYFREHSEDSKSRLVGNKLRNILTKKMQQVIFTHSPRFSVLFTLIGIEFNVVEYLCPLLGRNKVLIKRKFNEYLDLIMDSRDYELEAETLDEMVSWLFFAISSMANEQKYFGITELHGLLWVTICYYSNFTLVCSNAYLKTKPECLAQYATSFSPTFFLLLKHLEYIISDRRKNSRTEESYVMWLMTSGNGKVSTLTNSKLELARLVGIMFDMVNGLLVKSLLDPDRQTIGDSVDKFIKYEKSLEANTPSEDTMDLGEMIRWLMIAIAILGDANDLSYTKDLFFGIIYHYSDVSREEKLESEFQWLLQMATEYEGTEEETNGEEKQSIDENDGERYRNMEGGLPSKARNFLSSLFVSLSSPAFSSTYSPVSSSAYSKKIFSSIPPVPFSLYPLYNSLPLSNLSYSSGLSSSALSSPPDNSREGVVDGQPLFPTKEDSKSFRESERLLRYHIHNFILNENYKTRKAGTTLLHVLQGLDKYLMLTSDIEKLAHSVAYELYILEKLLDEYRLDPDCTDDEYQTAAGEFTRHKNLLRDGLVDVDELIQYLFNSINHVNYLVVYLPKMITPEELDDHIRSTIFLYKKFFTNGYIKIEPGWLSHITSLYEEDNRKRLVFLNAIKLDELEYLTRSSESPLGELIGLRLPESIKTQDKGKVFRFISSIA
ncbi:MAG: hypothetical protein LBB24_00390, partial [Rickettsiales bacterium]|nr:hypothetical protein [Rickettsiales bacterium]